MAIVQVLLTPLSEVDIAVALRDSHVRAFGDEAPPQRLATAWGQVALETAHGKILRCYNFGNVTAGASWTGDRFGLNVPPPDPPHLWFRAYASAVDGAADYWRTLSHTFAKAFMLFDVDPLAAGQALGAAHYYLADPAKYAPAMASLAALFPAHVSPLMPPPGEVSHDPQAAGILERAALVADAARMGLDGIDEVDAMATTDREPVVG